MHSGELTASVTAAANVLACRMTVTELNLLGAVPTPCFPLRRKEAAASIPNRNKASGHDTKEKLNCGE